eukprot:scaffold14808_cov56-Phaeocystis_antarctica.AAC.1
MSLAFGRYSARSGLRARGPTERGWKPRQPCMHGINLGVEKGPAWRRLVSARRSFAAASSPEVPSRLLLRARPPLEALLRCG